MSAARIGLVEDEAIIAQDLKYCLTRLGYDVCHVSSSGDEALEKIKDVRPDLVLMDIVIRGEKDGVDTAREIQERYRVPVVYLTAYGDEGTFERAKKTDPSGYLLKPVEETELRKVIEFALYKKAFDEKREAYEKEHEKTLSLLTAVLETANDGFLVLSEKGAVLRWNQKFLEMWQTSRSALSSPEALSFGFLLDPLEDPEVLSRSLEDLLKGRKKEEKISLKRKGGNRFEISAKFHDLGGGEKIVVLSFHPLPL